MSDPTHGDIQRDMGRMEGKQDAMGARLDRLEKIIEAGFEKVDEGFEKISERLTVLEADKAERKGMLVALAAIGGAVGTILTFVGDHLWKGWH